MGDAPRPCCGHLLWFPTVAGMGDLDFFIGGGIIFQLAVASKLEAIETLVLKLFELGHLRPRIVQSVVKALMHREQLGSTGIGRGAAVPHARHGAIERIVGIIGHVPSGIDFNSLDGDPVTKIFLFLSSPKRPGEHLRALERISRMLRTAA